MNFTDKLIRRSSVRDFKNEKISKEELQKIVEVINNAPSSHNMQQFSAIIITDQKIKDMISEHNYNQEHIRKATIFILFIGDRSRMHYIMDKNGIKNNYKHTNHEFIRMITDTVIAATQTHDALIDLGYGVTFVGGILNFLEKLSMMLDIPHSALPIVGLSIGKPKTKNSVKPKMNKVFFNKYNEQTAIDEVEKYSQESADYFANMPDKINFIAQIVEILKNEKVSIKWENSSSYIENFKKNI